MLGKLILATAFFFFQSAVNDCNSCIVVAQTQVTIQNPSFETHNALTSSASNTGSWNAGPIPSWNCSGAFFGSWQPAVPNAFSAIPDGSDVIFVSGSCTQNLGVTAVPNSIYTLTAFTGHRADSTADNSSTWIISLYAGTTQLCAASGPVSTVPVGAFLQQTLSCPVGASPPSGNLVVSLSDSGNEAVFDGISLVNNPHQVTLTWTDSINPSGTTYNVYRTAGTTGPTVSCTSFTRLNSNPVAALTYTDTTVVSGNFYCWEVRAINSSSIGPPESIAGDTIQLMVQ
jgi:hypothetical protein